PLTSLSPPVPPSTTSFPTRRSSDLRAYRNNPDTFQDNVLWRFMRNSLDSGVFKSQQAQWDKIYLPMWAVGNWSGMGLHLRGATEGYMRAASKDKKLRIHCGTHYHPFYSDDGRRDQ